MKISSISVNHINLTDDILSRKDQVNTKENNKDIKIFKDKLWKIRLIIEVEVVMFKGNQIVEENILLEEIWKISTRE